MCGIAGIFGRRSGNVPAMVRAMHHRGPDDNGVFTCDGAALGMARLAIIDLSPAGHQPMVAHDNQVVMVFNGEIYNFAELRAELEARGYVFHSRSDSEVVLRLYLADGDAAVERLRGMFAIAILDRRLGPGRERLVLARDHFGIKPLLYAWRDDTLIFASELKALLAGGLVQPEIDADGLRQFLTHGAVVQPRTMLAGVRQLLPGRRMIVEAGRYRIERFWRPHPADAGIARLPYAEQVRVVGTALDRVVAEQQVADVPVGAFLSGGIDSALLVALMSRHSSTPLRTFSVGFPADTPDEDETSAAGEVARHLGTIHRRVEITHADILANLAGIATALDQPSVDGANSYFVSRAAAQDLRVALSGTGGDELFAGYPWFAAMRDHAGRPLAGCREMTARLALSWRQNRRLRHRALAGGFLHHFSAQYRHFGIAGALPLLSAPLRQAITPIGSEIDDIAANDDLRRGSVLQRTSALVINGYLCNQLLRDIDAVSMAHSLEVRVPFLDPRLAELALALPDSSKLGPGDPAAPAGSYQGSGTKRILIDIGRDLLPAGFAARPKRGFGLPLGAWLRGPLRDTMLDLLSPETVASRGLLDPDAVRQVVDGFLDGRLHWGRPWCLMILELWYKDVFQGR